MKAEGEKFGGRRGITEGGRETREGNGGKYDQST
jgi:hypothetical protein